MTADDILNMTPAEFAASWTTTNDIVNTCLEALGFTE